MVLISAVSLSLCVICALPPLLCAATQSFVYLAGLQLLLTSGKQSWLALAASTVAGALYKANFCNLKKLRVSGQWLRAGKVITGMQPALHMQCSAAPFSKEPRHTLTHTNPLHSGCKEPSSRSSHVLCIRCCQVLSNSTVEAGIHWRRCNRCRRHNVSLHCRHALPQLPGLLVNAIAKFFGPLLSDPGSSGPSISLTSTAPAAAAGRANSAAGGGGGFGEGFYDAPAGRGPGGAAGGVRQRHAGGRAAAGAAGGGGALPAASPEALAELLSMGFSRERAVAALQQAGNDLQTAIALLVG